MAILTALQSAAIRLIGRKPSTVYCASGTFEMEIADLANEVAQDVAKYQDWQALVWVANITGNGEVEEFALPRSEEHTSELQALMGNSYAVLCLEKKNVKSHLTHQYIVYMILLDQH